MSVLYGFDVLILLAIVVLQWHQIQDVRHVRRFVQSLALPRDPREAVLHLARACFTLPTRAGDPLFFRFLPAIGASPADVVRAGGCCSGRSRLLILALAQCGTRAFQVTLYHREGQAQHCLVQAWVGDRPLLVDPSYGVVLRGPHGRTLGVADLQAGIRPESEPLPDVEGAGYPRYSYYDFDYTRTQTANWTMSHARRFARAVLGAVFGDRRIAQFQMPAFLEWPQHLAAVAALMVLVAIHLLAYVMQ